jgi:hypothetical protein
MLQCSPISGSVTSSLKRRCRVPLDCVGRPGKPQRVIVLGVCDGAFVAFESTDANREIHSDDDSVSEPMRPEYTLHFLSDRPDELLLFRFPPLAPTVETFFTTHFVPHLYEVRVAGFNSSSHKFTAARDGVIQSIDK